MHSITTGEGAEKLSKFRQCYYRMVAGSNLAHCFKANCSCVHYFPRFTLTIKEPFLKLKVILMGLNGLIKLESVCLALKCGRKRGN